MLEATLLARLQIFPNKQRQCAALVWSPFRRASSPDGSRIELPPNRATGRLTFIVRAASWPRRCYEGSTTASLPSAARKSLRTAHTARNGSLTRQRTPLERLLSIGMSREAAETALQQADRHHSGLEADRPSTQQVSAVPIPEAVRPNDVALDRAAQQMLPADRVERTVEALLDAGVPVRQLAAVIGEHPHALAADPGADWEPKVRHVFCRKS